jgi:hypothetical protein
MDEGRAAPPPAARPPPMHAPHPPTPFCPPPFNSHQAFHEVLAQCAPCAEQALLVMDADDDGQQDASGLLYVDDSLSLIDRLERYSCNGPQVQRLVHVREIACCAEEVGVSESVGRIVPLLKVIACDPDVNIRQVRQASQENWSPASALISHSPLISCVGASCCAGPRGTDGSPCKGAAD